MFFKKACAFFLTLTVVFSGIVLPVTPTSAAVDADTIAYLKKQDIGDDWITMALKAAGQDVSNHVIVVDNLNQATDIERAMLAIAAKGADASNYRNVDLVSLLDKERQNNQIGRTDLINDDIFGILAYYAVGVDQNDARIQESKQYILKHQNSDGGWSHATSGGSDTNDTAMAITALIRAGVSQNDPDIKAAIDYLKSTQNTDAGFPIGKGQASDSASTSWVISALQAAGVAPASLVQGTQTPYTFLATLKESDGSYKWKASTNSSPIMTAYVAIALSGKSYPVAVTKASGIDGNTNNDQQNNETSQETENNTSNNNANNNNTNTTGAVLVQFRIEGNTRQVCSGSVLAKNPLDLISRAQSQCGYSYRIESTSLGRYLERVNSDIAQGVVGWLYLVNWKQPTVGADDYTLQANDYVTWYYGEFDWLPLRTVLANSSSAQNGEATFRVEAYRSGNWEPVANATVHVGAQSKQTNASGVVAFSLSNGTYQYRSEKVDYIRSSVQQLTVSRGNSGTTNAINRSIPLQTNVLIPPSNQPQQPFVPPNPVPAAISFEATVVSADNGQLGFGNIRPGQTNSHTLRLKNTSAVDLTFTAEVKGGPVFLNFLRVNNEIWSSFVLRLLPNRTSDVEVSLPVPADYKREGQQTGELIIWAKP